MKFSIYCNLAETVIPLDYRRKILSVFKACLKDYNQEFFKTLYHQKDPIQKNFTFSVGFSKPKINENTIQIQDKKIQINFSTSNSLIALHFYNAMLQGKNKKKMFHFSEENKLIITNITIKHEHKILENEITFKIVSPLVVRDHNKDKPKEKDWFYTYGDEAFEVIFKRNLFNQLSKNLDINTKKLEKDIDNIQIHNINMKKIIVLSYDKKIPCTIGMFKMNAENYILNEIYQNGAGSKKSLGFSMLDII